MTKKNTETIYLKDYQQTPYDVENIELTFDFYEEKTTVRSKIDFISRFSGKTAPLELDGQEMELVSVKLNGEKLSPSDFKLTDSQLVILQPPEKFTLEIENNLKPQDNTSLEGLYKSSGNFSTQCESEGFRKITYFYDRPDVMTVYTVTLNADKKLYPVLLANGNKVDEGDLDGGRHWTKWEDPFKKPSYLFAVVAGNLACLKDSYKTASGRNVALEIYAVEDDIEKCHFAMESLKKAMKWDEDVYGLECDLDQYMIVAVSDFNMGAMENKGLNIFNTSAVLASEKTATDANYERIEAIIAHEYFHNWTGNRITCRDWFQLCLKEGLTVFRDQEFSSDMNSRSVSRIEMVRHLRTNQFPEDNGPMSHPVRPDSFVEINNFYTMTIYEKGAEICRMIHTVLGTEKYRKGIDLYFKRHDGQAVTVEDFVAAMGDANGQDLSYFMDWYKQSGTPIVHANGVYDADAKMYTLRLKQENKETADQKEKSPLVLPMKMALLDSNGSEIPLTLEGEKEAGNKERLFILDSVEEIELKFIDIPTKPVPSLFRDFSAPIKFESNLSDEELIFLMANDTNDFNRWDAGEKILLKTVLNLLEDRKQGRDLVLNKTIVEAFIKTLKNDMLDDAFKAMAISMPRERFLSQFMDVIDVDGLFEVRHFVMKELATKLHSLLLEIYKEKHVVSDKFDRSFEARGKRALKNVCLLYLKHSDDVEVQKIIEKQMRTATNMTDEFVAFMLAASLDFPLKETLVQEFYDKWQSDKLVIDGWFLAQATASLPTTFDTVKKLRNHPDFDEKNPNRVFKLLGFFFGNLIQFHRSGSQAYEYAADQVLYFDRKNPQLATRLVRCFANWKRLDEVRSVAMKEQIERIAAQKDLSPDLSEVVGRYLK